jgi:mRNA interferase MazF
MPIQRGQIYYVYLDPAFGHEIGGYKPRPVVVLSINDINNKPLTVTVVPGTSDKGQAAHFRNIVPVEPRPENGLTARTFFLCHQVRALDRGRFTGRPLGLLSGPEIDSVVEAVKYTLGIVI